MRTTISSLVKQTLNEAYEWKGFDENYRDPKFFSEFEKKFYGERPELPLKPLMPSLANRDPKHPLHWHPDKLSRVHCAMNCPDASMKPILAYDGQHAYIIKDNEMVRVNQIIKNGKDYWAVEQHAWNIFTDLSNVGAAGYRSNVRQRATFIVDEQGKPSKAVIYTVNKKVYNILKKYGVLK
jgi:hypothetical protein